VALALFLGYIAIACAPKAVDPSTVTFDGDQAYAWVIQQCEFGYRIPGTEAHRQTADLIIDNLRGLEWDVGVQEFVTNGVMVRNILAKKGSGPAVLLGAHYDTRSQADQEDPTVPVMGANDGASGVAVLLELARVLDVPGAGKQVYLAFFDAEDGGNLDGWDWIVGSSYMAEHWGSAGEPPLEAMVLVDMVGDQDLQLFYERNSDPTLSGEIWGIAHELGFGGQFIPQTRHSMLDDHIPFVRMGIPAVDIIDFDYPYWHTTQDTPDKVSATSLVAVGRTIETWLEGR
jgi:Zn-dependent M28 family amino/carboxypeptidase